MKKSKYILLIITACFLCLLLGVFLGRFQRSTYTISGSGASANDSHVSPTKDSANTGRININTAAAEDLALLPGIGDAIAQRIIEYRTQHGAFSSIGEIRQVEGIGEGKYSKIQSLITVGD